MPQDYYNNNIYDKITTWYEVIGPELSRLDILLENVYNMDKTGVMLLKLGSIIVLVSKDNRRDYRGTGEKWIIVTTIKCVSASSEYLNLIIIWPALTHWSNWTTYQPPRWVYAFSESGYNDLYLSLEQMKRVFDPQTKARANQKPRLLICNGFGTHETLKILEFCLKNNIVLCRLPSHTSYKLQPCDVSVFSLLKTAYCDQVERLYRSGVIIVNKEHFTALYDPVRKVVMTKKNILAGWAKAGMFLFNLDRVLRDIMKPTIQLSICIAGDKGPYPQSEVVPILVTLVLLEALMSLLNLMKQGPYNRISNRRNQKLVQKLTNTAQTSFA